MEMVSRHIQQSSIQLTLWSLALGSSAWLQTKPHLGDGEAVIRPSIGIGDRLCHQHVLSISPPDENIVQEVPLSQPGVYPGRLLAHREVEEGVGQQETVDITDNNYENWRLMNFWMQNRSFPSPQAALQDFIKRPESWIRQPFRRTLLDEREMANPYIPNARTFDVNEQGMLKEDVPTDGGVFPGNVINKHVRYRNWSFDVSVLRDSGLRFFNITYKSRLMIAEAGLEDTVTMYVSDTPFMQRMLSLESMYGVGAMWSELSPGIDCPLDAVYLSVPMVPQPYTGPKTILRGICLYESHAQNYEGASRRFFTFSNPDSVVRGAPGYTTAEREPSLYVVGITALFNYQYSFVNIFSPAGIVSMYVLPTGYVHVEKVSTQQLPDERFGLISKVWGLQFMLHTHNYLFYLDLDVLDERNVAEEVEISGVGERSAEEDRDLKDSGFGISMNRRTLQYELDWAKV
ncbi:unnamed protein product [Schistocephalus solidus]|uniref:Amine oxidase n=1 Tax=Schistocephalus solidus TaxID=70667 RepID=A0A183TP21_SCHSO|nr:unnamed protein product [Schistocephalus solidus]